MNVSITIPFRKALSGDFPRQRMPSDVALPTPPSDTILSQASKAADSASSSSATLPTDAVATSPSSPGSSTGRFPFPFSAAGNEQHIFNILVAEDNPLNSRLLETRLTKRGHSVQVAVDGQRFH